MKIKMTAKERALYAEYCRDMKEARIVPRNEAVWVEAYRAVQDAKKGEK